MVAGYRASLAYFGGEGVSLLSYKLRLRNFWLEKLYANWGWCVVGRPTLDGLHNNTPTQTMCTYGNNVHHLNHNHGILLQFVA